MKSKLSTVAALLTAIGALFLSGCATTPPLTQDEKAKIHSISISSNLGRELQHVSIGLTVFSLSKDPIPDEQAVLANVTSGVQKALESRGYSIAKETALADSVLVLERGNATIHPNTTGVYGAGFFVRTVLGIDSGTLAVARINFRLQDPKTGKNLASASVFRYEPTRIKTGLAKWSEISEQDRRDQMVILKALLLTFPEEGVKMLGL